MENIEQVEKCVEYHVTFGLRDFLKSQMGLGKRWRRRNIVFFLLRLYNCCNDRASLHNFKSTT